MTYDHSITLISKEFMFHADRDPEEVETPIEVLCSIRSVTRGEFYQAAAASLRPSIVVVLHAFEYAGQQVVEHEGIRYEVIRTYPVNTEEIELTCQLIVGGEVDR